MDQTLQNEDTTTLDEDSKEFTDSLQLHSRSVYANCGIIGIDSKLEISEGYDGGLYSAKYDIWPKEDVLALADIAIARWTAFRKYAESL